MTCVKKPPHYLLVKKQTKKILTREVSVCIHRIVSQKGVCSKTCHLVVFVEARITDLKKVHPINPPLLINWNCNLGEKKDNLNFLLKKFFFVIWLVVDIRKYISFKKITDVNLLYILIIIYMCLGNP